MSDRFKIQDVRTSTALLRKYPELAQPLFAVWDTELDRPVPFGHYSDRTKAEKRVIREEVKAARRESVAFDKIAEYAASRAGDATPERCAAELKPMIQSLLDEVAGELVRAARAMPDGPKSGVMFALGYLHTRYGGRPVTQERDGS